MRTRFLQVPALLLLSGMAQAQLAPGAVDPGFVYPQPVAPEPDSTNAVPLPDGFIVVKSRVSQAPDTVSTLALTLVDRDGRVIADGFGTDGTYTSTIPGEVNLATAAIRSGSGALVLGGFKRVGGSKTDSVAAIAKVGQSGALDTAFGQGGVTTIDVDGNEDRVAALAELADGRLAVLAWSISERRYYDCDSTRMTLVLVSSDGLSQQVSDWRLRDSYTSPSCREALSVQLDRDGRLLYGNELGVFDTSGPRFPGGWRYGPFASDDALDLMYSQIDGNSIKLLQPPAQPSSGGFYPSLAPLAGFAAPITYERLASDPARGVVYLGFATDGGRAAIARFRLDGSLDTGWGQSGVAVVEGAGRPDTWMSSGAATDIRLLKVQGDGSIVVATADGFLRRLAGGQGVTRGVIKASIPSTANLDPFYEGAGRIPIRLQRIDGTSGAVGVDVLITDRCDPSNAGTCSSAPNDATAGKDFVAGTVRLEWADGDSGDRTVDLTLVDDKETEGTEFILVRLANATGGVGVLTDAFVVPIYDNDPQPATGPTPTPPPAKSAGGGGLVGAPLLLLLLVATCARQWMSGGKGLRLTSRSEA